MEKIEKIWLTDDAVWISTADGRKACEKFNDYPRLRYATKEQRANYEADEHGIHWEDIDEDLSFEGFFDKRETTLLYKVFMAKRFCYCTPSGYLSESDGAVYQW